MVFVDMGHCWGLVGLVKLRSKGPAVLLDTGRFDPATSGSRALVRLSPKKRELTIGAGRNDAFAELLKITVTLLAGTVLTQGLVVI